MNLMIKLPQKAWEMQMYVRIEGARANRIPGVVEYIKIRRTINRVGSLRITKKKLAIVPDETRAPREKKGIIRNINYM